MTRRPYRQIVVFARGGGWGTDRQVDGHDRVAVIRGTDFAAVRSGRTDAVPRRWEKRTLIAPRRVRPDDVLLEISGGSAARGQSTGRSLFVGPDVLPAFDYPVIPASFCRVVRFDPEVVDPRYAYYGLRDMYLSGRAGDYENQSTGISNFQFERFLDAELLRVPPMDEQRRIVAVLAAFDDKIEINDRVVTASEELLRAEFDALAVTSGGTVPVTAMVEFNPRTPPPDRDGAPYVDMAALSTYVAGIDSWSHRVPRGGSRFRNGDTLLARITPCLENGKAAWVDFLAPDETATGSTEFVVMRARAGVPAQFPYFLARDERFRGHAIRKMAGSSGRQRVNAAHIAEFLVAVPDPARLAGFGERADAAFAHLTALRAETRVLEATRDALLPELMSGRLHLP
ncbi:restriction endonuclease subunit S [Actinoplanes subglobosus]|uniref:Restriction endonuclease subunit S n=1 Tax=Actinoplanes subglobosus TaxID=1547892 RepID=A0ABV8J7V3_9ACTN